MSIITIEKLYKKYTTVEVLTDLSFDVHKKQIVSIVGPSGCGKTTLLKCIIGLEQEDGGLITINNVPKNTYLQDHRIAYVPQQFANFSHLTVRQNIEIAITASSHTKKRIDQILKDIGLQNYQTYYPNQLSGGMQQRVALARALIQDADIVAMDEPLASLDVQTKQRLQELLLHLCHEYKKTLLFVTHDIEEALYLSDQVIVLESRPGRVQEIIQVPFSFPRNSALRFNPEFQNLRKVISFIIRSETIKTSLAKNTSIDTAIKLGLYYWPGNTPFFFAEDQGWYKQLPTPLELISFKNNQEKIDYWKQGKLDLLNVTLDAALDLQRDYKDTIIVMSLNQSNGGDALISTQLTTIQQLAGKRIALEKGEASHFFLSYILYKNNLSIDDVIIVDLPGDEIGSALINNRIDAAILWEPWLSKTIELSGARILGSTIDYPILADVLIAKQSFIEKNEDLITQLKSVWDKSVDRYQKKSKDFIRAAAPIMGLSDVELGEQLNKLTFYNSSDDAHIQPIIKLLNNYDAATK